MAGVANIVTKLVQNTIENKGYELVDVEYLKEGKDWYLRIYIDKEEGVSLDDCEVVSREVSEILDKENPIDNSYILEVSSPGVERPLKKERDFERFSGKAVYVKTFAPIDGKKEFKGILRGMENGNVAVEMENQKHYIPKDKVASAHLTVELF